MSKMGMAAMAAVLVAGCATQPKGISDSHIVQIRERGLVVHEVKGASAVQVKSKGMAIGGMVVGSVVGSVAGGGASSLAEGQEIGMQTNALVQRGAADIRTHAAEGQTPALEMSKAIDGKLAKMGVAGGANAYRVEIKQVLWLLSYDSMFGSDNYRLHYDLETAVLGEDGKAIGRSSCQGDGPDKRSLDAWREEDGAKIKAYARDVGEACAGQLLSDIGLRG